MCLALAGYSPMTDPSPPTETPASTGLPEPSFAAQAIAEMLRPLARLMIDHGLQLPVMVELLKKALVDEALSTFALDDKGSSDTRVALLTGVHRKDVKRLRETRQSPPATPMVPVAASVVARWISDPRFLNADHSVRALARTPGRGRPGEPDFSTLVAEVSRDLGARAVLDELVRLGVVMLREDGYVELQSAAFVPQEGLAESFHFLAANVSAHLATAVHNLSPHRSAPLLLEQSAFSQGLSAEQAEALHQQARSLWADCLQRFLQSATVAEQRSEGAALPQRVRFGVYFHQEAEHPTAPETGAKKRKKRSDPT